jgi:hypothetical protein
MNGMRGIVCAGATVMALTSARPVSAVLFENFDTGAGFTISDGGSLNDFYNDTSGGSEIYTGIWDQTTGNDDFGVDVAPADAAVPNYTGFSGNYLVGENQDGAGDSPSAVLPVQLDWTGLNISGLTNLYFSGLFAAVSDDSFESGLTGDYIRVLYQIDNAGYNNLLWFSGEPGETGNEELGLDPGFDGTGEGTDLTVAAGFFSASIPLTGSTLDLRILMSTGSTGEQIAFDSITIAVPEPSALLFGGLVCGVIGVGAAWQRLKAAAPKGAA